MYTDKKSFYNWIMVLAINIGAIILIVHSSMKENIGFMNLFQMGNFVVLGISLFVSVIPIFISHTNSKWKNYLGYGIPVLLLLPLPYFVWDYYTCTGKFCQLGPLVFGWVFALSAIVFAIFYTIGIYSKKWNEKVVLYISIILPILIIGGFGLLAHF